MSDPTAPMDRPDQPGPGADAAVPGPRPQPGGAGSRPPVPPADAPSSGAPEGPPVPPDGPADRGSLPRVKTELRAGADRVKHTGERKLEEAKAEVERTKQALQRTKDDYAAAIDAKAGGTAEDPEQAERQVVDIRGSIERDLAALSSRVPTGDALKERARRIGINVGLPVAGVIGTVVLLRKRGASKRHQQQLQEQAEVIVRELRRVQAAEAERRREERERHLAEEQGEGGSSRTWLRWLAVAGGLGAAIVAAKQRLELDEDLDDLSELEEDRRDLPVDPGPPTRPAPVRPSDDPVGPPVPPGGADPVTGRTEPPGTTGPGGAPAP